jgi:hypothetical protein
MMPPVTPALKKCRVKRRAPFKEQVQQVEQEGSPAHMRRVRARKSVANPRKNPVRKSHLAQDIFCAIFM